MRTFAVYQHDSLPDGGFKTFRLFARNESYQTVQAVKIGFSWPAFLLAFFLYPFIWTVFLGMVLAPFANKFRAAKLISLGYNKIGETEAENKAAVIAIITGIPAIQDTMKGEPA